MRPAPLLRSLSFAFAASATAVPASAGTWYVRRDAGPGGDGTSWALAFQTVQDGLAAAQPGDEVWVARGVYRPGTGASPTTVTFALKDGVALYGGFEGQEVALGERDPDAHETVLSGDLALDDGPNWANRSDNCRHVVTATGVGPGTVLDGFTVRGGRAFDGLGGGGILETGANPTYRRLVVRDNESNASGGGFKGAGSSWWRCRFLENRSFSDGGGLCDDGDLTMVDCVIARNEGDYGGGVHVDGSNSTWLIGCVIVGNVSPGTSAAGAFPYTSARLVNCVVAYNQSAAGPALSCDGFSTSYARNSLLWGNTSSSGVSLWQQQIDTNGFVAQFSAVQGSPAPWNADPLWVDPLGPDGVAGTSDDDFRLSCLSPYIDRGSNALVPAGVTTDLAGGPRFLDDPATPDQGVGTTPIVDLGPYEFACGCDGVASYCAAVPNSTGQAASISWSGSTSVFANDLVLHVEHGPPSVNGLFFYGANQVAIPWGDGLRCVGGSLFRLPVVQLDAAGAGSFALDLSVPPAGGGPGAILAGSTWNAQFYYRDTQGGPAGWNYSDALEIAFCR